MQSSFLADQQALLGTYRANLRHLIRQAALHGGEQLAPLYLMQTLHTQRAAIQKIKAALRACGVDVADDHDDNPPIAMVASQHSFMPPLHQLRLRQRLIEEVWSFWKSFILAQSHGELAREPPMLKYLLDAVYNPFSQWVERICSAGCVLPAGTSVCDVFDAIGGELLILGAPQSGKTALLLDLAMMLLMRVQDDRSQPVPVILSLRTWTDSRARLDSWIVRELALRYDVPETLAKSWLLNEEIVPLLDDLHDVPPFCQASCVEAINTFRRDYGLARIAICCRSDDYATQGNRLKLHGAVEIVGG